MNGITSIENMRYVIGDTPLLERSTGLDTDAQIGIAFP